MLLSKRSSFLLSSFLLLQVLVSSLSIFVSMIVVYAVAIQILRLRGLLLLFLLLLLSISSCLVSIYDDVLSIVNTVVYFCYIVNELERNEKYVNEFCNSG